MRKLVLLLFLFSFVRCYSAAVTHVDHHDWGGRLGDKLIMYVKAKWVAHAYNLPFYYKQFPYSDQFVFHDRDPHLTSHLANQLRPHHLLRGPQSNLKNDMQNKNALYIVHYYFLLSSWGSHQQEYDSQEIMAWPEVINDQVFLAEIKKSIKPRHTLSLFTPPTDRISVAVHVRKGDGHDWPLLSPQQYDPDNLDPEETTPEGTFSDIVWPLKFPPDQFYIDQIKRISQLYDDKPLYVHLFTDHINPTQLIATYKKAVNKDNITYGCRENENRYTINVLEDLFSMAQFDCLIRGGSNFPQISQLIGNYQIVLYPQSRKWIGNTMIIDQVGTYIQNKAH